jgi:hypothetical protein
VEGYRPLEEVLEELRRVFSEQEIDRLLRHTIIRQAEGAPADRDYLLKRVHDLQGAAWEEARPTVAELLRILAHMVASIETLWATVARMEQRLDRLEEQEPEEWES